MKDSLRQAIDLYQAGLASWKELNQAAEKEGGKVEALDKRIVGKGWAISF